MLGRYRYTASTLTPGEEIELVGRLHYFALIIPFALTSLSVFACFTALSYSRALEHYNSSILNFAIWLPVIALVIFTIASWLKRNLIEMVCTNKRVVRRTGVINVTTEELNRERIESVDKVYWVVYLITAIFYFPEQEPQKLYFHLSISLV